ncbi:MAG: TRAP transporter TatT component family protein [Fibrobacterota bacterium]|nr:TRAP transporter TatT component family protein [Chitinispirillaceae bacterium]
MNFKVLLCLIVFSLLSGCSFQHWAIKKVANGLATGDPTVFSGDDDPVLIGDALPFTLKFYETLLSKDSLNDKLLLATGKLFCLYSQGYVLFPSDTLHDSLVIEKRIAGKRAKKLFLRGRNYILKGLTVRHDSFLPLLNSSTPDSALKLTTINDTAYLYWAAMSWMGAISSDRSDIGLGMTMKKALLLVNKVALLDSTYGKGSIDEFFCVYYSVAPKSLGGDTAVARNYLNKAIVRSDNSRSSVFVTAANFAATKSKNREEFNNMLERAMLVDLNAHKDSRLTNTIYQHRAKWMLEHADRYFTDETVKP